MILPAILVCAIPFPGLAAEDPARGRAVLESAVTAIGGPARLAAIESWDVEGTGRENLTAEIQGLAPDEPTWRDHEERIGVDARTLAVAWHRRTPRNDGSVRWRRMIRTPESSGFVDFVAGFGRLRPSPAPEPDRRGLARRIPHFLLHEASTRATRTEWEREIEIDGRPHDVVAVDLPDAGTLRLAISRTPALLKRVSFERPMPTLGEVTVSWEWPQWKEDDALGFIPSGHRIVVNQVPFQEVQYSRYRADSPDVWSLFEVPEEMKHPPAGPAPPSPSSRPATGEVAPGVHVAEVSGFTVMFVAFRDFLVAFDAPEAFVGLEAIPGSRPSTSVAAEYRSLLERTYPAKPLRYVVVSHHHGDHLGGIRELAANGATVIVAPGHRAAAAAALGDEGKVETVSDLRTLSDGSRSLEIRNAGRNPHTEENLFVWLPPERILFQGDLFYYSEGSAFPPSGRETMNRFFAEFLRAHAIDPAAIYGVHNQGAAPRERLLDSLR